MDHLYLRRNVKVEPLVDQWYAWPHLIPPQTAARNITERHLKIMESYISAPQVHANAVKNPKMLGGPFIDYDGKRVGEIRELRRQTLQARAHLIDLSKALATLDTLLQSKAQGYSLNGLYTEIPELLRGYVELVYDLNNHPNYRLLEPLLYRSRFYDRSIQSLVLSLITEDERPFVLSTPRLPSEQELQIAIPFDDERVDDIFRTKKQGRSFGAIKELLGLNGNGKTDALLEGLFDRQPTPAYEPYTGKGVRWRYFGHACILIETAGVSMMFDPVLSYTYENQISRYTYQDLPDRLDYVLITHNHQDHVLFETLLQIRHKTDTIVVPRNGPASLQDPSLKLLLQNAGFRRVIELGELETLDFGAGRITGLPFFGEHSDLDIRTKLAYLIRIGRHSLLFAADSCNIEPSLYRHLHDELGDIDALFVGMECDGAPLSWLYGPLMTNRLERGMDESRRLAGSNYEQALDIVDRFNCREVYVYAMGQEPWLNYVMSLKYTEQSRPIIDSNRLIDTCRGRGITAERLFGEKEILLEP